jgi:hypothetical protein
LDGVVRDSLGDWAFLHASSHDFNPANYFNSLLEEKMGKNNKIFFYGVWNNN